MEEVLLMLLENLEQQEVLVEVVVRLKTQIELVTHQALLQVKEMMVVLVLMLGQTMVQEVVVEQVRLVQMEQQQLVGMVVQVQHLQ